MDNLYMLDFRRSLGSPRKETKSVRERSAGSFPEQRRVIEPTIYNVLVKFTKWRFLGALLSTPPPKLEFKDHR